MPKVLASGLRAKRAVGAEQGPPAPAALSRGWVKQNPQQAPQEGKSALIPAGVVVKQEGLFNFVTPSP